VLNEAMSVDLNLEVRAFKQSQPATDLRRGGTAAWVADAFEPLFLNPHLQTILPRFWPTAFDPRRFPTEVRYFRTEPDTQVLAHCNRRTGQSEKTESPSTLLIVHGLTGSSTSPYVLRLTALALEAGFDVIRLNLRNCGGTEHLCSTLYHSGLTSDLRAVSEQLQDRPLYLVGFSMGGNVVLKLAGEWGHDFPSHLRAVCAVSIPLDLAACADRLSQPRNRFYEVRFLRELRETVRLKQALLPGRYSLKYFSRIRSIVDFDEAYTAPCFGFRNAQDYYEQCSARNFLTSIRVPTLMLQAQDDPFIPFEIFDEVPFGQDPNLNLCAPPHGGHVGFLSRQQRFWDAEQILRFCKLFSGRDG
jgi:predicted alpha/beta-fold hydrolase